MSYQAVLCDLGGVVVEFDADRLVHQVAQLVGRSFDEVQRVVYDEALLQFEIGRISPRTYYEGLRIKLCLPWSYEQFVAFWNNIFSEKRESTALIQRLQHRCTLIALTNTNALHLQHVKATIPSLGFFHDWVASCDVGCRKPDPQIYRLALARAKVPAHAVLYIDDRPEMVEAGRAVGLTAIRFESGWQLEQELRALGFPV